MLSKGAIFASIDTAASKLMPMGVGAGAPESILSAFMAVVTGFEGLRRSNSTVKESPTWMWSVMSVNVRRPSGPCQGAVELKMELVTGRTGSEAVSVPMKPESVTLTWHAARSWTVDLSSMVMWFMSQGADELWCAVLTVQRGSMINMGSESVFLVPGRKSPLAKAGMRMLSLNMEAIPMTGEAPEMPAIGLASIFTSAAVWPSLGLLTSNEKTKTPLHSRFSRTRSVSLPPLESSDHLP
mmetsp:Transcript_6057/g.14590  ORF Transcript_6057/g.14590 Transcript_6057/m.14590 type:complete len:240 (+) Transcript_6057:1636-2355(+)